MVINSLRIKRKREQKGRLAERWAALFLQLKGYKILKRRYQNPLGEIDLILQKGGSIIFCEVKARDSLNTGLEAFSPHQQRRIVNGARHFQTKHPAFQCHDFRFDYLIVHGWRCHHLKNAWQ